MRVWASGEEAAVRIEHAHTNITRIEHNQKVVYENEEKFTAHELDKSCLNIKDITAFANEVKIADDERCPDENRLNTIMRFQRKVFKNTWGSSDWKDYQGRKKEIS